MVLAVLSAGLGVSACGENKADLGPPDGVAIEIGTQKITNADVDRRAIFLATQPTQQGQAVPKPEDTGTDDFQKTRRTAAEQLRDEAAFGILAARCGKPCAVTPKEIEDQITQLIDTPVASGGFGKDRKAFEKALSDRGITVADLTRSFTANRYEQNLATREEEKVKYTDADARAYYTKNIAQYKVAADKRLSHILLESKPEAEKVRAEVTVANFAEVAANRSQDPSATGSGGDLGTVPNAGLLPEVSAAAQKLAPGKISAPVQSTFGWHILLVRDIAARTRTFAEAKDEIRTQELQVKRAAAVQKWRDTVLKKVQDTAKFPNARLAPERKPAATTSSPTVSTGTTVAPPSATTSTETTTSNGPATP